MSLAAANAMRLLAGCFQEEAEAQGKREPRELMEAMARAHERCADKLEAQAKAQEDRLRMGDGPRFDPKARPPR